MRYKDAGVDIDKAEVFKKEVKKLVRKTSNKSVLSDIGNFGGLYSQGKGSILTSTIDGVGTKTIVASIMNQHENIGYDVVSHGANDLVVQGAKPLFCLDYIGTSKLDNRIAVQLIKGMVKACRETGCVLIGGETAQMPGVYNEGQYDLVGCVVGVVSRKNLVDGSRIKPGDVVVGLASTGLHTNGYTLARRALLSHFGVNDYLKELKTTVGKALLMPHRNYSKIILPLLKRVKIKGIAHITGGGLIDNIPRVLPDGVRVVLDQERWQVLPIFKLIQKEGNVPAGEMYRTFNMGIGMVLIMDEKNAGKIKGGKIIGRVEACAGKPHTRVINRYGEE